MWGFFKMGRHLRVKPEVTPDTSVFSILMLTTDPIGQYQITTTKNNKGRSDSECFIQSSKVKIMTYCNFSYARI